MAQIVARASALLNARAEDVYEAIADYRNRHPHILPSESLYDLQVEEGGYGAGTVIRFKARTLGAVRSFYQRVSEPEPGHILVERDIDSVNDLATTFTVTPVEDGQKTQVEISTSMRPSPGLTGLIERIVVPSNNTKVYRKELQLLEAFAQTHKKAELV
jgi:hypothetical protein